MSVYTNVNQLYEDVQKYMDRDEASIVSKIPLWVHMAEDELDRRLRHPAAEMVQTYTVKAGDDYIAAPKNMLELKNIRLMDNKVFLQRTSYEMLYDIPDGVTDYPTLYASQSYRYMLNRPVKEDTVMEFTFYIAPEKLSQENNNNLYLAACGDFLLYTATSLGFAYDANKEDSAYFRQLAEQALMTLQEQIEKEEIAGSTLVTLQNFDYIQRYF